MDIRFSNKLATSGNIYDLIYISQSKTKITAFLGDLPSAGSEMKLLT
jgi:hypothetical protein